MSNPKKTYNQMKTYIQPVVELIGMNTESLIALSGPYNEVGGTEMSRRKQWDAANWSAQDVAEDLIEE